MVLATLLSPALSVSAATGQGSSITTTPISVDLTIPPGQTQSTTLQVENNEPQPVTINVQAAVFSAHGTSGQAAISADRNDPSLKWVSFSPNQIVAKPGIWYPVQMTISLPSNASLGYYYAAMFKPELTTVTGKKNVETFLPTNAVLVLVDSASGNEVRSLHIVSFSSAKTVYEYLPATFSIDVRNTGNIFLVPEGTVYISRDPAFGSSLAALSVNQSAGRVLPQSNRIFSVSWTDGFPVYIPKTSNGQPLTDKKGTVIEQLKWDFSNINHIRIGKYYAKVAMVYNNGQRDVPQYAVVSFWVIPWKFILAVLFIVAIQVFLIIALIRYRQMYRRASRKKPVDSKKAE